MLVTFMGMYVVETTGSYLMLSLVTVLPSFMGFASKLWGMLSDYYGRRKPFMLLGTLLSALVWAIPLLALSPWTLVVVTALSSALWSIGDPALYAALVEGAEDKGRRLGYMNACSSAGWALGCLLSGFTYDALGQKLM